MKLNRELQNIGMPLCKDINKVLIAQPQSLFGARVEVVTGKGKEDLRIGRFKDWKIEGDEDIILKLPLKLDERTSVVVYATHNLRPGRYVKANQ